MDAKRHKPGPLQKPPSRVFSPYRALGAVTNHVPFAVGALGQSLYIATSVGRQIQIYDAATLRLLFVSPKETSAEITALWAHFQHVYAAHGSYVTIFKKARIERSVEMLPGSIVRHVTTFGSYIVAADSRKLAVLTGDSVSVITTPSEGEVQDIVHLPTHLNKVVVVTDKRFLVYNVRTQKLVYRLRHEIDGTCACSAPVLDVMAVGTKDGKVYVVDVRKDKIIQTHTTRSGGSVVSVSFRTDGAPLLAVGLGTGHVEFFDLDSGTRAHVMRGVHKNGLLKAFFLPGQAVFATSGHDNHLREFVFDKPASEKGPVPPPRHLRSRGGHLASISAMQFLGEEDHFLLLAAQDRSVWSFSLRKDAQAQELLNKTHTGPVTCLAQAGFRGSLWGDTLTGHAGEDHALVWSSVNKKVTGQKFSTMDGGVVSLVCVSMCGNFGFVGSANGNVAVYSMQSGTLKRQYRMHKSPVVCIQIDSMNRRVCCVGLDGKVCFFDFAKLKLEARLDAGLGVTASARHAASGLVALALDDLAVLVIDASACRIVRQLVGHRNRVTSVDFSPDGRWLVLAGLDGTVRTWSVVTGACIDGFFVDNAVTLARFLPTGAFLATAHAAGHVIRLWTNKGQFGGVGGRHVAEEEFGRMNILPGVAGSGMLEGIGDGEDIEEGGLYESKEQIEHLVTFLSEPRGKFGAIVNLDTIRKRNKPKEPPKKPELAPFFLQEWGENGSDAPKPVDTTQNGAGEEDEEAGIDTKMLPVEAEFETEFTKLLKNSKENKQAFLDYVVGLSPLKLDLEIRSLDGMGNGTEEMSMMIRALTAGLKENKNYEMYQAIMVAMFRAHGDVLHNKLWQDAELKEAMDAWYSANNKASAKLDDLVGRCSGVLSFLGR